MVRARNVQTRKTPPAEAVQFERLSQRSPCPSFCGRRFWLAGSVLPPQLHGLGKPSWSNHVPKWEKSCPLLRLLHRLLQYMVWLNNRCIPRLAPESSRSRQVIRGAWSSHSCQFGSTLSPVPDRQRPSRSTQQGSRSQQWSRLHQVSNNSCWLCSFLYSW